MVKLSLFTHAHSSPLALAARLHRFAQTIHIALTMTGLFWTGLVYQVLSMFQALCNKQFKPHNLMMQMLLFVSPFYKTGSERLNNIWDSQISSGARIQTSRYLTPRLLFRAASRSVACSLLHEWCLLKLLTLLSWSLYQYTRPSSCCIAGTFPSTKDKEMSPLSFLVGGDTHTNSIITCRVMWERREGSSVFSVSLLFILMV